jgi:hypothetical protein
MKTYPKRKSRPLRKGFPHLLLTGVLLATAILTIGVVVGISRQKVTAKDPTSVEDRALTKDDKAYITRYVGGQRVQIDPQTGQVKPLTPEEARKLAEALKVLANQSSEGLKQVQHPDGSVSIDLQGRFQNVAIAKRNDDGSVSQSCVDNPQAGAAFFGIDPQLVGGKTKAGSAPSNTSPAHK